MTGKRFANYLVQEKLGEGGMGIVYKAIDLNLDRPVAIKSLHPELAGQPEVLERFRAEAKTLATLNHLNITTLYSLQEAHGQCVMVMEYIHGHTFEDLICQRGRLPVKESILWFKQALLGIGSAHRKGVVHRDIKPANLMLAHDGIVKVMDFGIAKVLGAEHRTRYNTRIGTFAYMSPEQARSGPVDARSDIYSLGITLFRMLSGQLPFTASSDAEFIYAHVHAAPALLGRFCPELPRQFENAVMKALQKTPEARFQTVEEFGAALDRVGLRENAGMVSPVHRTPPAAQPKAPPKPVSPSPRPLKPQQPHEPRSTPSPVPAAARASTDSHYRSRNRIHAFGLLVAGVAILFCLLLWGLYRENIPALLACFILFYFLPVLIAAMLFKRNGATVVKLNLLNGWTGIGWLEAMKRALADDE